MQRGNAPPAPEQRRQADDRNHRDGHTRAQQREEPGGEAQPVAPVDRSVVVGEQEMRQAEHECTRERDLERPEDVLRARAEQHERRCDDRRRPRPHARPAHDEPEQRGRDAVQCDRNARIEQVAAQADRPPQRAVHEQRKRDQVPVVGAQEVVRPGAASREELPLVGEEPQPPRQDQVVDEARRHDGGERDQRSAIRASTRMSVG